jgi:hypothetical protein
LEVDRDEGRVDDLCARGRRCLTDIIKIVGKDIVEVAAVG